MINIIVAMDKNGGIGKDNKLLAHIPKDLKHFKEITNGHTVVMGYNTWLSLPKKPLPNRRNIVLTTKDIKLDGAEVVHSVDEVLETTKDDKDVFVIGGAKVYEQMIPYTDRIYSTHILHEFEADTFFPEVDGKWFISNVKEDICGDYKLLFSTMCRPHILK